MGQSSTIELKLGTGTDPSRDNGHTLTTRAQYSGDASLLSVLLYDGATFIDGFSFTMQTSWTNHVLELYPESVASITDYSDLRVRLTVTTINHPSGTSTGQVSWLELQYPEADGTQGLTLGLTQRLVASFLPTVSGGANQAIAPNTAWNVDDTYGDEYGESYGGGGPTVFTPSFNFPIEEPLPELTQRLMAAFGPAVDRAFDFLPALAQQLVAASDPALALTWSPALTQQLLSVFEDLVVTRGGAEQGIVAARRQQLLAAFTPVLHQQIQAALAQQLTAAFAPSFGVDIAVALAQQLVTSVDPVVTPGVLSTYPVKVEQLVADFAPVLAPGTVDISPALVQQLVTTFAPSATVTFGTLVLVQRLVAAFNPAVANSQNVQVHFYLDQERDLLYETTTTGGFGTEAKPVQSTGVGVNRG